MAERTGDGDQTEVTRESPEQRGATAVTREGARRPRPAAASAVERRLESGTVTAALTAGEGVAEGARLATLLLSDLVGSSAMVQRSGDAASAELFKKHDRLARDLLEEHRGLEIDKTDGFLLLFDRPWQAVLYALDYHRALARLSRAAGVELESRVGIHLGEIILRRNPPQDVARGAKPLEVEGLAKPTAARLMSVAGGRQTLMTQAAFDLARRSAIGSAQSTESLQWLAHGSYLFKGVEEPVEVFEVGVEGVAPLAAPTSSEKVTRVADEETILGWRPAPGLEIPYRSSWVVREKLGEGGFGEVWRCEQTKTGEVRVFKFCYETERLRSLQREITVFRLLKEEIGLRDDIARVLDWNLEEAPYFVEFAYVEGGNLVDWAEAQGGIGELPIAERLEIVAQVATALGAAHSVGVLHKDIKPANVLMTRDAEGRPRAVLTDFGVGLVTDRERLASKGITVLGLTEMDVATEGASASGTHMYMAPELLAGKPSTIQADIYALGVMLYQVAAGELGRPLAHGWERHVEDRILRDDIAACVEGTPRRRPGNAEVVAERLRTLEERRATRQAEERAAQAAQRAQRRRKVLTTVAAVSSVFLVVVSFLAIQAMRARADAERRRGQAEQLIDFMLNDLHEGLDRIGRLDLLAGVAQSSKKYFDSLTDRDESPDALEKRGTTLQNIGNVLLDQGDAESALAAQQSAVRLFEDAMSREPSNDAWLKGLSASRLRLGLVLVAQGENDAAQRVFGEAIDAAQQLAARRPGDPEPKFAVARSRYQLARLETRIGDTAAAVKTLRENVAEIEALTAEASEVDWREWELLLDARMLLAGMLRYRDELAVAADEWHRARLLAQRLAAEDPTNAVWPRQLAWIHLQTGALLFEQADLPASLESFEASRAAYELLTRTDPERVTWRGLLAESLRMIGKIHDLSGEPESAMRLLADSLAVMERLVSEDPTRLSWLPWLARVHDSTGSAHLKHGDTGSALASYEAARELRERLAAAADDDPGPQNALANTLVTIGKVHAQRQEGDLAREKWTRALEIIEPVTARTDQVSYRDTHAQALLSLGRIEEARPLVLDLLARGWDDAEFLQLVRDSGLRGPP